MQTRGTALVTGCSSGIGRATATALTTAGFTTYATARDVATLTELVTLGCREVRLDVTDEGSMSEAVAHVEAEAGGVDLLVNNAGFGLQGPLEELALDDVRRQFETNVFGLLRMSQLVLPGMRYRRSGRIVNVGSTGGLFTTPGSGAYHSSKYAVESLTDAMRAEVAGWGIEVSLVQPGGVLTEFGAKSRAVLPPDLPGAPYDALKASIDRTIARSVSADSPGVLAPEQVAAVILRAATARRPRTRYKVGFVSRAIPFTRRRLPDRAWDAVMRRAIPG